VARVISRSRGDSVQGELLQHGRVTLRDGEGWEPIGDVLRSILFPSIVIGGASVAAVGGASVTR
jgi:hypothetical protein